MMTMNKKSVEKVVVSKDAEGDQGQVQGTAVPYMNMDLADPEAQVAESPAVSWQHYCDQRLQHFATRR